MVENLSKYEGKDVANEMKTFISKYEQIETQLKE
jgi:hypothetical protein